jgi:hypothetical protein
MKMTNRRTVVVSVIVVANMCLLGTGLLLRQKASRADDRRIKSLAEQISLRADLRRLDEALAFEQRQCASLSDEKASLERKTSRSSPAQSSKRANVNSIHVSHPELSNLWIKSLAADLTKNYGPFFNKLAMSPETIARLKEIKVARLAENEDLSATIEAKGLSFSDPAIKALYDRSQERERAQERALLGDEAFHALQEYERALPARYPVNALAAAVAFSDPLTSAQADLLSQTIANASSEYQTGKRVNLYDLDWPGLDWKAQSILTPIQLGIWLHTDFDDYTGSWPRSMLVLRRTYDHMARADEEASGSKTKAASVH